MVFFCGKALPFILRWCMRVIEEWNNSKELIDGIVNNCEEYYTIEPVKEKRQRIIFGKYDYAPKIFTDEKIIGKEIERHQINDLIDLVRMVVYGQFRNKGEYKKGMANYYLNKSDAEEIMNQLSLEELFP